MINERVIENISNDFFIRINRLFGAKIRIIFD